MEVTASSSKGLPEGRAKAKEGGTKRWRKTVSCDIEPPDPAMPKAASHLFFQSHEPRGPCLCLSRFGVELLSLTTNSPDLQFFFSRKLSFPTSLPLHKLFLPP